MIDDPVYVSFAHFETVASVWFNDNCQATTTQTEEDTTMGDDSTLTLEALRVDEWKLKGHVNEMVRSSVEETLNGLLNAEADSICRAQRYERFAGSGRSPGRA